MSANEFTTHSSPAGLPRDYQMREGWRSATLSECMREVNMRAAEVTNGINLPVLSLTKNFGLVPWNERFDYRVATEDVSKYKVVPPGCIAYNPYVLWEGAIHLNRNRASGLVSPVYLIWESSGPDVDFLDLILKSPLLLATYERLATGVVKRRRSVRKQVFERIEIPLPPLAEQKAIAKLLRAVQSAKEARRRELVLERERKAALMFQLFNRGTRRDERRQTAVGRLPRSWRVVSLGEVVPTMQYGVSIPGETSGRAQLLRMNNIVDGRVKPDGRQFVTLDDDSYESFKVRRGDVLFNRTNSFALVGKSGLFDLDGDFVCASYLIRLVPDRSQLSPAYLSALFSWDETQTRLKGLASRGVSQSNISAGKLKDFPIGLPPLDEQAQIVSLLDAIDVKLAALLAEINACDNLFCSLLEELMAGRLSSAPLIANEALTK